MEYCVKTKEGCGLWICTCKHQLSAHGYFTHPSPLHGFVEEPKKQIVWYCIGKRSCKCRTFKFLNNNDCSIECMFKKKMEETEINGI